MFSLISINLSNFNTSKVKYMDSMFNRCLSLKHINLTNFDTSHVIDMRNMFYGCKSLISINLSNFDTSQVENMEEIFYGCNSLVSIDLSNFDMINCDSYENMFSDIRSIKYFNLYQFKNDKIISRIFNSINNNIFICQKYNIISNPNIYNCCNSDFEPYDCISSSIEINSIIYNLYTENNIISFSSNLNNENIITSLINDLNDKNVNLLSSNNLNTENINLLYSNFLSNKNIIISDNDNLNADNNLSSSNFLNIKNITISDSDNPNTENINIPNTSYIIIYKNKDSSSILYTFAIVSIITTGVIFITAIIAIIIYICRKKKLTPTQRPSLPSHSPSELIDLSYNYRNQFPIYEYEPKIDKKNPIIIIFSAPGFGETKILADYDKTIEEFIKFYFNIIKRPDLYGDKSINFLINGSAILPPYPNDSIETLLNNIDNYRTMKIVVNDPEDKIIGSRVV